MAPLKHKVWIDCDVGSDDTFALVLACHSPGIEVLGISTVYGNSGIEYTTKNTLGLMTAFGNTSIPIYKGTTLPYLRVPKPSTDVHGVTGLGNAGLLPEPTRQVEPVHAVIALGECLMKQEDDSVYLVVTGPFTNIGLMLAIYPEAPSKIKQLVAMGGAIGLGNKSPASEMNIWSDPEASAKTFSNPGLCGKLVMLPIETTHTMLATKEVLAEFHPEKSKLRQLLHNLLSAFNSAYAKTFNMPLGGPVHDPGCIFYILHPESCETKFVNVQIAVGGICDGRTVCDMFGRGGDPPNVHIITKVDVPFFWRCIIEAIDVADKNSTMG